MRWDTLKRPPGRRAERVPPLAVPELSTLPAHSTIASVAFNISLPLT
jgi:hypothetical protein